MTDSFHSANAETRSVQAQKSQSLSDADIDRIANGFELRAANCRKDAARWRKDFGDCKEYRANLRRAKVYEYDAKELRATANIEAAIEIYHGAIATLDKAIGSAT